MKHNREPSLYLEPAIHAIYLGYLVLPIQYCRALLEIVHFKGYQYSTKPPKANGVWWEIATDEGRVAPLLRFSHLVNPYPQGKENYHLITMGQMSPQFLQIVRHELLDPRERNLRVFTEGIV